MKTNSKARTREQIQCLRLVRKLRKAGVTLEAIADEVGVVLSTVSRWASGISVPHSTAARRILPVLEGMVEK